MKTNLKQVEYLEFKDVISKEIVDSLISLKNSKYVFMFASLNDIFGPEL